MLSPKCTSVSSRTTERCLHSQHRHFRFLVSRSIIRSWYANIWHFLAAANFSPVRSSDAVLSLSSIPSSLSFSSLDQHLTVLKRDIITHFIEYVLRQPLSVSLDSIDDTEHSIYSRCFHFLFLWALLSLSSSPRQRLYWMCFSFLHCLALLGCFLLLWSWRNILWSSRLT